MALPESWMNELMSRNDIVSVVSEYTALKPSGGRMWGLCPFHPERQASFTVSPDKQLFHCFSCKAGGSVIQFIMQAENLPYIDAVRFLAQRVNMDMPDEVDDAALREQKLRRERIYKANREAARFYHSMLLSNAGGRARDYLKKRGIDGKTAVRFGLGYAPDDWDSLFLHLTGMGFGREDLIDAGLCIKGRRDSEKTYDFFHDRLMFPIIAANGSVLAFGGRSISGSDDMRKYMNTSDTLVYNKKHNVYGINMMKGRKLSDIIMVEGYMDVVGLYRFGIDNAVASLGTALTPQQARLIGRYVPKIYYAYDGDTAGQKNMLRGVDIFAENGVEPRVIVIPEGKDPDEFVRAYGRDAFLALKDSAVTAQQFKLESIETDCSLDTADGREKYAKAACRLLAGFEPVEAERYMRFVAERSGMSVETIRSQYAQLANGGTPGRSGAETDNKPAYTGSGYKKRRTDSEREKTEKLLLACMMVSRADAARIVQLENYSEELFSVPGMAKFAGMLTDAYKKSDSVDIRMLLSSFDGAESDGPSAAAAMAEEVTRPVEAAADCISWILRSGYDERIRELAALSAEQNDPEKRRELLREQMELTEKSRALGPAQ